MRRRKGLLDEEKFLPPLPEQLPRGVSSLPGYGQTSPVAQGLLGFTGRNPTYSVMSPEAQQMSDAYRLGEQASVASQLYGSMLPFAAASTMASAQRAGSLLSPLTVFHGSPHKFSKFDASKIGTGEGAQAYGHGLYMAEAPEVAQYYARMDSPFAAAGTKGPAATIAALAKIDGGSNPVKFLRDNYASQVKQWGKADVDAAIASLESGNLYKVDLPDEQIAKMLDWDKPLGKQSKEVKKFIDENGKPILDTFADLQRRGLTKGVYQTIWDMPGKTIFDVFGKGGQTEAKLKQAGIPGVRYLDEGSRGKGGTSNFVVFPGEESKLRIMEVNGKPVVIDEEELRRSGLLGAAVYRKSTPSTLDIKEKVFSQIGSKSLQEPVSINPKYLTFRETDQGRLEQVRELFPKGEPMNPIVTIKEVDGSYSILDGHNRAVVAMERKQKIPMVSVTRNEYEDLNQSGFDDMEISFAALTRANQDDAASDLNRQFSGSDVGGRGMKAYAKLPEYGAAVGAGLLSPAVLEYLRRRDEEGM